MIQNGENPKLCRPHDIVQAWLIQSIRIKIVVNYMSTFASIALLLVTSCVYKINYGDIKGHLVHNILYMSTEGSQ